MKNTKEKDSILVSDFEGVVHIISKEEQEAQRKAANGCFAICVFFFITLMISGLALITVDQYKKNKRHPNVISGINSKENKIIISDVDTKQERIIDYTEYKDKNFPSSFVQKFENQIKYSKIGDTVLFVSPEYNKLLMFELNRKAKNGNALYLNQDSINTRFNAQKQRQ